MARSVFRSSAGFDPCELKAGRSSRPPAPAAIDDGCAGRRSLAARIGTAGLERVRDSVMDVIADGAAGLIDDVSGGARLVHAEGAQSLPALAIMARADPPPGSPIKVRQHDEACRGGRRSALRRCGTRPAAPVEMPGSDGSRRGAAARGQPRSDLRRLAISGRAENTRQNLSCLLAPPAALRSEGQLLRRGWNHVAIGRAPAFVEAGHVRLGVSGAPSLAP